MNRRQFLAAGAASSSALFAASFARSRAAASAVFALDSPPVLQNPTANGVTVAWAVNAPATGWVEYGTTEELGQKSICAVNGLVDYQPRFLSVRLGRLSPGQPIFYRVVAVPVSFKGPYRIERGEPVRSEIHRYTPPSPDAATATFAVLNDTHEKVPTLAALVGALAGEPADLTVWNGDVFDDVNSDDQVVANVLRPASAAHAAGRPVLFVPGNHDHRGVAARGLTRAFTPWPDEPEVPRCFAVRHGPLALIGLDTGEDKPDHHPAWAGLAAFEPYREMQRHWLERVLQRPDITASPYLVVFCHIPLHGLSGENGADTLQGYGSWQKHARDLWHPLIAASGAQLVISGHTHRHRFDAPTAERPYAQLIGGGPELEHATLIRGVADAGGIVLRAMTASGDRLGQWRFDPRTGK